LDDNSPTHISYFAHVTILFVGCVGSSNQLTAAPVDLGNECCSFWSAIAQFTAWMLVRFWSLAGAVLLHDVVM
jgi:hypothetical protein